jgi:phage shock protein PspC (stress-responsive transcriptional regulator)
MNEQSATDPRTGLDKVFATLRGIPVRRRTDDKWIGGVCSGIADRLGVDPVIVRAALVLLTILGGIGVTVYLVAWLLLPNDRNEIAAERALRDGDGGSIVLMIFAAFALFGGSWWGNDSGWGFPWGLALTGLLIWWLIQRSRNNPEADQRVNAQRSGAPYPAGPSPATYAAAPPPTSQAAGPTATQSVAGPPTSPYATGPSTTPYATGPSTTPYATGPSTTPYAAGPPTTRYSATPPTIPYAAGPPTAPYAAGPPPTASLPVAPRKPRRRSGGPLMGLLAIGLALVTYGSLSWLGSEFSWTGDHQAIAMAGSLAAIGLLLVVLGLAGWRSGFVAFLAVVLAIAAFTSTVVPSGIELGGRVGDATWTPNSVTAGANYHLGVGDGVLNLSELPTEGLLDARIPAYVGLGELKVIVPEDLTVKIVGHVGLGEILLPTDAPDEGQGGSDVTRSIDLGDGPTEVVVDAGVGVGQLTVVKE